MCRFLATIAGWLAAQNKPVPPDDGSRRWDQALAARLKVLEPMGVVAYICSNLASIAWKSESPGWSASLRFRLLCASAFCTDAAPQVLLAAWHGPRATALRQEEAARLSKVLLEYMLAAASYIVDEVRQPAASALLYCVVPSAWMLAVSVHARAGL